MQGILNRVRLPLGVKMTICRDWLLVKKIGSTATAEPLRCRSWGCEVCAPERQKRLIAQAIGGNPNTFITLTMRPTPGEPPETRAKSLVAAWREIRRRASEKHKQIDWWHLVDWMEHHKWRHHPARPRNKLGMQYPRNGTIPFLAVFERHKSGEPHLHILCRSEWIPQRWLSDEMRRLTGSFIVDVRRTYSAEDCAAYCAKYAGKEPWSFGTCKRYWASQDYEVEPPEHNEERANDGATFEIFRGDALEWSTQMERSGWMVQWLDDRLTAFDMRKPPPAAASPPPPNRPPPAEACGAQPCQASDRSASPLG